MSPSEEQELIADAWGAVSADEHAVRLPPAAPLAVTGSGGQLASMFAVEPAAVACVGAALMAASALHHQRGSAPTPVSVDRAHVAAAVRSERFFRRGGASAGAGFASLSRFWRTADGWVRTHANYPWHRDALLSVLGTSDDPVAIASIIAERPAQAIEEQVFAAGGVAAAVRTLDAWCDHTQGRALAGEPLVGHHMIENAAPRTRQAAELPAAGVRVLDLTRVIAGPVCTRYLAALGADVLRVDPPNHLDMRAGTAADTLLGKRSSLLDLNSDDNASTAHDLLEQADVVVCGYRPGALDRFGLSEEALAERHPGLVIVYLSAWGHHGPWASRRGFDSIVQAPTGIAMGESTDGSDTGSEPGALPCQLLDHGTGYLAAAAVFDGLRRQGELGGTHVRRLSLARTAWWLTSTTGQAGTSMSTPAVDDSTPWLAELDSAAGPVTAVLPPGRLGDQPLHWPRPLTGYGRDRPTWTGSDS